MQVNNETIALKKENHTIEIKANEDKIFMVASGKLDDVDYDKMLPLVKDKIEKHNKVSWYFQMKDIKGWTANAFWREVKFDLKNADKLNKVAIVGEKKWHELMTDAMKPFISVEVKYFDETEADNARKWISNPEA